MTPNGASEAALDLGVRGTQSGGATVHEEDL